MRLGHHTLLLLLLLLLLAQELPTVQLGMCRVHDLTLRWAESRHALCVWLLRLLGLHARSLDTLHGCHGLHCRLHALLLLLLLLLLRLVDVLRRPLLDESCHELRVGLEDIKHLLLLLW